jgi:hypothetical protein
MYTDELPLGITLPNVTEVYKVAKWKLNMTGLKKKCFDVLEKRGSNIQLLRLSRDFEDEELEAWVLDNILRFYIMILLSNYLSILCIAVLTSKKHFVSLRLQ